MIKLLFFSIFVNWQLLASGDQHLVDTSKNLPSVVVKEKSDPNLIGQTKIEQYPQVTLMAVANIMGFYDKFMKAFQEEYPFIEESDRKKFNLEFKTRFIAKALNLQEKEVTNILKDFENKHEAFLNSTKQEIKEKIVNLGNRSNSSPKQ